MLGLTEKLWLHHFQTAAQPAAHVGAAFTVAVIVLGVSTTAKLPEAIVYVPIPLSMFASTFSVRPVHVNVRFVPLRHDTAPTAAQLFVVSQFSASEVPVVTVTVAVSLGATCV